MQRSGIEESQQQKEISPIVEMKKHANRYEIASSCLLAMTLRSNGVAVSMNTQYSPSLSFGEGRGEAK
jgi:hypothetical protein